MAPRKTSVAERSSTTRKRLAAPVDPVATDEVDEVDDAPKPSASLSIGELAKRTGVSTRTIRYYEELGILPRPQRTDGGTRRYPREYMFYVEGARTLKDLGFGLEEIAELGKFALTGTWDSERSRGILTRKLSELEHRIRVLNRLHDLVADASKTTAKGKNAVPPLLRWVGEDSHNGGQATS